MIDRKETTQLDDYKEVVKCIFEKDLKLLHIIDRFSLTKEFWLTLGFTKIINVQLLLLLICFRNCSNFYKEEIQNNSRKCKPIS